MAEKLESAAEAGGQAQADMFTQLARAARDFRSGTEHGAGVSAGPHPRSSYREATAGTSQGQPLAQLQSLGFNDTLWLDDFLTRPMIRPAVK